MPAIILNLHELLLIISIAVSWWIAIAIILHFTLYEDIENRVKVTVAYSLHGWHQVVLPFSLCASSSPAPWRWHLHSSLCRYAEDGETVRGGTPIFLGWHQWWTGGWRNKILPTHLQLGSVSQYLWNWWGQLRREQFCPFGLQAEPKHGGYLSEKEDWWHSNLISTISKMFRT